MNELLQEILDTVDKKQVKTTCKRVMKKLSFKSVRDIENVADLALWLYIYDYYDYALQVCDLIKDVPFTGNYLN